MTTDKGFAEAAAQGLHAPESSAMIGNYHIRAAVFESGEHSLIGDHITLSFNDGTKSAKGLLLSSVTGPSDRIQSPPRTLGHVIALAGDYFGDPSNAISTSSNPSQTFMAAFDQMRQLSDQADAVEAYIDAEIVGLNTSIPPSSYYASQSFLKATAKLALATKGRYLALANTNWDHFFPFAFKVYSIGHQWAIEEAISAGHALSTKALEKAYLLDAFACHYLTDLFSAGHIRTPRKALYDIPMSLSAMTGLLAKAMHDEDSLLGLKVHNSNGDSWMAYGDKKLLDQEDLENNGRVIAAVQTSMDEVWHAFQTGKSPDVFGAVGLAPSVVNDSENHAALFVESNGSVSARDPLLDTQSHNWTTNWTIAGALSKLKLSPKQDVTT